MYNDIYRVISILGRSNPGFLGVLGIIQASESKFTEADKILTELMVQSKHKYISPFWIAVLNFVLDRKEQFFKWLEKGYREHDVLMIFLNVDPLFDPVRSDPKFQSILRKLNLIE